MPVGSRTTNSVRELLPKMMQLLAEMKLAPDADQHMPWILNLEAQTIAYARQQGGGQEPDGLGFGPGAPGLPGATPAAPLYTQPAPGPGAGLNVRPPMPPVEDLRRMLTGTQ